MKNNKKIIIGSGLSGPLLAILLSNRGYDVDLYEKRSDQRVKTNNSDRSINLALSHRGIQALKSANIFDQVDPLLIPMKGRMVHLINGEVEFQPYSVNSCDYINSISRRSLNNILIDNAEQSHNVKIYFNHSLSQIDKLRNQLIFSNEKKILMSNHIFGADGTGSIIRKYIDSNTNTPSRSDPLGHNYKELNIAASKNGDFQLEPNALHIWPREGFMLIALPNMDKSFTCTLFLNKKGKVSFEALKDSNLVVDFFNKYFSDVLPLLDNFPQNFFANPNGKLGTIYSDNWQYNNQFCLIGDAAHAIVPFFGQGMNASFEDCEILMKVIDENQGNWNKVFQKYNQIRKPDGDAIAQMAIENYLEMRDLVIKKNFLQEKEISNILWENFPNRFIPRYNMVSFTSIPYSEIYKRGKIQKEILEKINIHNPDYKLAEKLINKKLAPIK